MKTFTVAVTSFLAVAGLVTAIPMPQDLEGVNTAAPLIAAVDKGLRQGGPVAAANTGQSMADPGVAAKTLTNVLGGTMSSLEESADAAPSQNRNNAPQFQSTGNQAEDLAKILGGERK
ncbi:uncharacterized protein BO88DRAFT_458008 [Aspergillus vadensis CBS 113365]|uniref:Uncharacterized protein n=1 Tax=Aspergillus vadensis (strain CBS 113365 / IMI 142717 / IBT 24658) TaxID=1448311 RepID=A0A319AVU3_ASPVC|nr:hypothetical protein BO88DRAFT_458008 [Aspergillus vadensis CBS 113365]PYH64477.1 hypothetical protein BO88DRAFT_458008 [Aspergillus vadensis CBS 113365]